MNDGRQLELHRSMAMSPARFVEVLEALMSQGGEFASRAWRVLGSWRIIPGAQDSERSTGRCSETGPTKCRRASPTGRTKGKRSHGLGGS